MATKVQCPKCKMLFDLDRQGAIDEMRKDYPNVVKPWSRAEKARLVEMATAGAPGLDLEDALGRPIKSCQKQLDALQVLWEPNKAPETGPGKELTKQERFDFVHSFLEELGWSPSQIEYIFNNMIPPEEEV